MACQDRQTPTLPPPSPPPHLVHYVAPGGTRAGDGTLARPWDLGTALAGAGGKVQPGDTVWLRGGTYRGSFRTALNANATDRIVFRQFSGERATLDGTLRAEGSYLTFWGFEIMQSNPVATQNYALQAYTSYGRFINLVIHDAGVSGVSFSDVSGVEVELYGCTIYNNGTHENLDHGIYAHNTTTGTKSILDNVLFNNYARGIQIFEGSDSFIENFDVEGNISFNNGTISDFSTRVNLLISAPAITQGMVARDNMLSFSAGSGGINIRLGNYGAQYNRDIVLENNYAAGGGVGLQMENQWDRATVRNNTIIGDATTAMVRTGGANLTASYQWTANAYARDPTASAWVHNGTAYTLAQWQQASGLGVTDQDDAAAPATPQVFVRLNKYEPGRAHIVIYNWGRQAAVPVDISGVVRVGDQYEVRNVQDLFAAPVTSGTYGGGATSIPMTGVNPPAPIGRTTPNPAPRTGPDFDVFLLTSTRP